MSFDAIAPHYRWIEQLTAGPLLQRCRTHFISEIANARNILLLGEGRGRFLAELLDVNPAARITCVDASQRMLDLMQLAFQNRPSSSLSEAAITGDDTALPTLPESRVRSIHADLLTVDPGVLAPPLFDAIASHFFLDCFTPDQLSRICETVGTCATPGAAWLIADFREPERGWRRVRARWILWLMYRFFRATTRLPATRLTRPDSRLSAAGFRLAHRRCFNHGLLHSDVWIRR